MKNRVAVTGLGVISPLGIGIKENWTNLCLKETAVSEASFDGAHLFPHSICGTVPEFDIYDYIPNRRLLKLMNRESMLASAAAKLAIKDAHLENYYKPESTGLYLGTGLTSGEMDYLIPLIENALDEQGNFSYELLGKKALPGCNPLLSFKILPNMALSYISILFDIRGHNMAFNPWPGNTAQAIGEAMRAIQNGSIECALAGGCDSKNHFIGFTTFSNIGILSNNGICSPFSEYSDGLILSEGASVVILENYELAIKRGAQIYSELTGYHTLTDSLSPGCSSSYPQPLINVMVNTMNDAGLGTNEIDGIISGANSICESDHTEAAAIHTLFRNNSPLITGTKSLMGDILAASPAFDFCIGSYSFLKGGIPALFNNTDTKIPLNFSTDVKYKTTSAAILINSFGPGLVKTSLLLRNGR